jgi:hypothetical protein
VSSQVFERFFENGGEGVAGVSIVVEVNLHFPEPHVAQFGERFDETWVVLLARKEVGVSWGTSVGVANAASDFGIALSPAKHTVKPLFFGDVAVEGLVVIANGKEQMAFASWTGSEGAKALCGPTGDPEVDLLLGQRAQGTGDQGWIEIPETHGGLARARG